MASPWWGRKQPHGSGVRLREERLRLGMTQAQLAEKLGVAAAYVSQMETGRQEVSDPVAAKMELLFGTEMRWLLYGEATAEAPIRLKQVRKELGMTQKELAGALGISPAYLSLLETGRQKVSVPVATKLRDQYGVDAVWLLYGR